MKVKAKRGLIYQGMIYKAGEVFEVKDTVGYAFTWLMKNRWVEPVGVKPAESEEQDDLLATPAELPPLDETPKKGKKNA